MPCKTDKGSSIHHNGSVPLKNQGDMRTQTRMRDHSYTVHTTWKGVHQWLFSLTRRRSTASPQSIPTSPCWKHSQRRCHLVPSGSKLCSWIVYAGSFVVSIGVSTTTCTLRTACSSTVLVYCPLVPFLTVVPV